MTVRSFWHRSTRELEKALRLFLWPVALHLRTWVSNRSLLPTLDKLRKDLHGHRVLQPVRFQDMVLPLLGYYMVQWQLEFSSKRLHHRNWTHLGGERNRKLLLRLQRQRNNNKVQHKELLGVHMEEDQGALHQRGVHQGMNLCPLLGVTFPLSGHNWLSTRSFSTPRYSGSSTT